MSTSSNTSEAASGNDTSNTFELVAKPMPKTSMYDEGSGATIFVFGPTGGGERGILIEARALPGGQPMEGIPCSIISLTPPDSVTSGVMTLPIGETRFTDASGVAEFPVTYRRDLGLFSPATFVVAGGPSYRNYRIIFRRCASNPEEATYMAVWYPGRPELGEAYADPHLRVYGIAGSYVHPASGVPDIEGTVTARLFQTNGALMWDVAAKAEFSEVLKTLSFRHDRTMTGIEQTYNVGSMNVEATTNLAGEYHIGGRRIDVNNDFPPLLENSQAPFLYAPVKSAPVGEPIYLQWPTYANKQPGEEYRLSSGDGLSVQIFPFTFGEVALARIIGNKAFSPVIDLIREVNGKSTLIDRVLLRWE
ncbi:hypothetical protein UC34_11625 [Pandoraea vervacti]|uniref:Uncharacterized protein n=1 Tax=Pandoraea vervacti TaxID=656178 RepID=A0ABN4FYW0_9BURK|nr:hypothetical protein [Pandoraea vervacti]AJP57498.1 hypothetical protein UC34_11625 [Pandoraea vervacti]